MSIEYLHIAKGVALRANQLKSVVDAADGETNYTGDFETNLEGVEIPFTALKETILAVEKRIASICARSKNPVLMADLYNRTSDLASSALIDPTGTDAIEMIGGLSNPLDAVDGLPCTEKPKQTIARYLRNTSFYRVKPYHFCIEGMRIYHTRTAVYFEGSSWSYEDQSTNYDNELTSPLPQEVETWFIAEVLAHLPQENWFVPEANHYAQIAMKCEQDVRQGLIPTAVLPDSTVNQEPVKN